MDDRQKEFISFMYWKACVDAVNDMEKEKWERANDCAKEWSRNNYAATGLAQPPVSSWAKQKEEKERESIENLRIQSIPMPEKPERKMEKNDKIAMGFGIVCWCAMVFLAIDGDVFFAVIEFIAGIIFISDSSKHAQRIYKEKMADYELAQRDFPQYQRMIYERRKAEAKKQKKS